MAGFVDLYNIHNQIVDRRQYTEIQDVKDSRLEVELKLCRKRCMYDRGIQICQGHREFLKTSPLLICYYLEFLYHRAAYTEIYDILAETTDLLNKDFAFRTNKQDKTAYLQILLWKSLLEEGSKEDKAMIL